MTHRHSFFDKNTKIDDVIFDVAPAHRVKQTHSNIVIEVNSPQTEWIEVDGIITRTPNLPIGVITADCTPLLFYGDSVIGAAHAGWQGAVNGVLENTVKAMTCDVSTIHAYIGPCISQKSYEVSAGFEKPFLDHNPESERFFRAGRAGNKLQFDLAGYCAFRLALCGLTHIHIDGTDTLTHTDYHSHRGGASATERNLSAIMING
jgi:YfiH family protein